MNNLSSSLLTGIGIFILLILYRYFFVTDYEIKGKSNRRYASVYQFL